jgi:cbb3-type cytochrome oxidase subunit 3
MQYLRAVPTIALFFLAVYVFLLSPEGKAEFFQGLGIHLKERTYTALSILGMVFGALFSLRLLGEAWIAQRR